MAHNHIQQKAYPPGQCPSCDLLWDILREAVPYNILDIDVQIRVAKILGGDYGDDAMHSHLTDTVEKGIEIKVTLELEARGETLDDF